MRFTDTISDLTNRLIIKVGQICRNTLSASPISEAQ
jgi:hypothetical protein